MGNTVPQATEISTLERYNSRLRVGEKTEFNKS